MVVMAAYVLLRLLLEMLVFTKPRCLDFPSMNVLLEMDSRNLHARLPSSLPPHLFSYSAFWILVLASKAAFSYYSLVGGQASYSISVPRCRHCVPRAAIMISHDRLRFQGQHAHLSRRDTLPSKVIIILGEERVVLQPSFPPFFKLLMIKKKSSIFFVIFLKKTWQVSPVVKACHQLYALEVGQRFSFPGYTLEDPHNISIMVVLAVPAALVFFVDFQASRTPSWRNM
jgi:hypothetical protein